MGWFWYVDWHYREGRFWLERALAAAPEASAEVRADAANSVGLLAYTLGDFTGAAAHLHGAQRLAQESGAIGLEVRATLLLGIVAEDQGDYATAEERLVAAGRLLADGPADPIALTQAVFVAYHRGVVAFGRGDWGTAETRWQEAANGATAIGNHLLGINCLDFRALLAITRGDHREAARILRERLIASDSVLQAPAAEKLLATVATLAAACSEFEATARLLGAAVDRAGAAAILDVQPEGQHCRAAGALAREALGATSYAAAWEAGRRLRSHETAADIARVLTAAEALPSPVSRSDSHGLTPREREVLQFVARGQSNREIACALFISVPTVKRHLTNIFGKLGVASRAAAADYARTHLLP